MRHDAAVISFLQHTASYFRRVMPHPIRTRLNTNAPPTNRPIETETSYNRSRAHKRLLACNLSGPKPNCTRPLSATGPSSLTWQVRLAYSLYKLRPTCRFHSFWTFSSFLWTLVLLYEALLICIYSYEISRLNWRKSLWRSTMHVETVKQVACCLLVLCSLVTGTQAVTATYRVLEIFPTYGCC